MPLKSVNYDLCLSFWNPLLIFFLFWVFLKKLQFHEFHLNKETNYNKETVEKIKSRWVVCHLDHPLWGLVGKTEHAWKQQRSTQLCEQVIFCRSSSVRPSVMSPSVKSLRITHMIRTKFVLHATTTATTAARCRKHTEARVLPPLRTRHWN